MKPHTTALANYLAANLTVVPRDLYTISLVGGTVLHYCSGSLPLTIPSANFPGSPLNFNGGVGTQSFSVGPRFGRSKVSSKIGVEPTELDISVYAGSSDLIGALTWQQAVENGFFDGAIVELDRFFMPAGSDGVAGPIDTSLGAVVWFYGRAADIDAGRSSVEIKVKDFLDLIAVQQMPRRLFQAGCTHIFGDAMCGYDRVGGHAANGTSTGIGQVSISALAGSVPSAINISFSPSPSTAYDQGTVIGTSGANSGVSRTINTASGGIVVPRRPFPFTVGTGDGFHLLPGCDHTLATCNGTLLNILRFGGMPFVPPPELAV